MEQLQELTTNVEEITNELLIEDNFLPTDIDNIENKPKLPELYQRKEVFDLSDVTLPYKYNSKRQQNIWKILNSDFQPYQKYQFLDYIDKMEIKERKLREEQAKKNKIRAERKKKRRASKK